ncbi:MAG: ABC transporter substrate-binding protein [Candidatus Cohnella colombiensis]|uniref:ABC transporter substrate-binding protein n=1 Tax=Candidatus Cohnella colombiensis TaxID=3121368 RepID=A0AA95F3M7_9BACL|nr:MAG: ABC transporter substrate-binding protein [Cohnella sp.]
MERWTRKAIWIVFFLLFFLSVGCSTSTNPVSPSNLNNTDNVALNHNEQVQENTDNERQIVVGFSQLGSESDWRNANTRSIQDAAKEAGIELLFANAEQSQEKQFEAIRSFIEHKVDVIAVSPVIESGWEPILLEAKQAGIPVILSDRAVQVSDPSLYVTIIGSDFYEEGRKAGKYLIDKMRNETGPVGIVELQGTFGSSPSIERGRGFRDVIKDQENLTILQSEPADFTYEKGKEVMRAFLKERGSEIKVLFAHNDDMALGAIDVIEEYGLRPGKDIVIISVDGTRKAFEMMTEGKINAVVECNPLLGPMLMQAVGEIIAGRTLPKRIVPPESVFTEELAEKEVGNRQY